ncbi:uncharacterized protein [Dermacentor albipictus]|uniref:uncharacterized protein n=1 Tax=Dermacentor albipictus TaxID=60249 RepID=UPI0038FBF414
MLSRKESSSSGCCLSSGAVPSLFFVRAATAWACVRLLSPFLPFCVWRVGRPRRRNQGTCGHRAAAENQLQRVKHAAEGGPEGLPATPHLAVIGSSMGDIKKIIVAVDAVEFISTRSLEKAMGLLLGAFFVFNVAYPPDCPLTMEFSQRYLGQINPTKGRGKGRAGRIAPKLLSLLIAL